MSSSAEEEHFKIEALILAAEQNMLELVAATSAIDSELYEGKSKQAIVMAIHHKTDDIDDEEQLLLFKIWRKY